MSDSPRRRRGAPLLAAALAAGAASAAPSVDDVVRELGLEAHVEGGYFRRTYAAGGHPRVQTPAGERYSMTSIFYLLTRNAPTGHFHRNRSDIVHYFQLGDPITYYLLHPDGRLETVVMGQDLAAGQRLQLTVPGGIWKASSLGDGPLGYGLISEAVSPGFDYADMTLGEADQLARDFPRHAALIRRLTHGDGDGKSTQGGR
ncbi:MAG TPA: cupin domain-containing protein [Pseudohaliea sp.]|nr:cupin domain-containing protein [Pseudohaliea sp.]